MAVLLYLPTVMLVSDLFVSVGGRGGYGESKSHDSVLTSLVAAAI